MNHQEVRNQYLQVHGIDPVEIEVGAAFNDVCAECGVPGCVYQLVTSEDVTNALLSVGIDNRDEPERDDEPSCHATRHSNCTCEDSRDE